MNDDELRALGPEGLAPDRKAALRADLLARIAAEGDGSTLGEHDRGHVEAPAPDGPERSVAAGGRRWAWVAAAAAVVLIGLGALLLAGRGADDPDPSGSALLQNPFPPTGRERPVPGKPREKLRISPG